MYKDEELIVCPECGDKGIIAPNIFGKETFYHKRPSRFGEMYFSFSEIHKIVNHNLRKAN